jgi:hypothetical protein
MREQSIKEAAILTSSLLVKLVFGIERVYLLDLNLWMIKNSIIIGWLIPIDPQEPRQG